MKRLDISDATAVSMPMRNLLAIIAAVCVGVWAYFGVLQRVTNLETKAQLQEKDLIQALEDDVIAGAGLDVYDKEPLPQDHKLRFLPNALLTPHLGYVTEENYSIFFNQMIENLNSCIEGKPKRLVN